MKQPPKYSVVIPVYNRPDEVAELLESLCDQTYKNFEIIIVEDGSKIPCKSVCDYYADRLNIRYFFQENGGPGKARNNGMQKALGEYIILFDSDCVIPPDYFVNVEAGLAKYNWDSFGGPDDAHESFSDIQKAINYTMTSFLTTGGIRGKKTMLTDYQARSFNMGFRKKIVDEIGGFTTLHPGEDPDLSYRIKNAGYTMGLIPEAKVYHKRRIDFRKFYTQVYKFGVVRIILSKWHKGTFKITYLFPTLFFLGCIFLAIMAIAVHPIFLMPIVVYALAIFTHAAITTKNIKIAFFAMASAFIQFFGYGYGFLKSWVIVNLLCKDERKALPKFFFE